MKVYQLLQQGTNEQVIILAPDHWPLTESQGLPDFYEVRDSKGKAAILLREFNIQELPAVQPKALGATNRT